MRTVFALFVALGCLLRPTSAECCGWDWETFAAEAKRLPCINDLVLGAFATHTTEYYETTLEATDLALAWAPYYTEALDAKGMALVHLGRYAEAEPVLRARHSAAPDAYASHANLGTLFTFNGQYERALSHVERALGMEPKAHFGREKYHRSMLVYLQNKARQTKPQPPMQDFLGLNLTAEQARGGSLESFERSGMNTDVFDALASMIAVYGAEQFADLYLALGNVLALRGEIKLAWAAYRRATELNHPAKAEIETTMAGLLEVVGSAASRRQQREQGRDFNLRAKYRSLETYYVAGRAQAAARRARYHEWERTQLRRGLRPWVNDDVERCYARMDQLRERCKTGGLIQGRADAAAEGGD